MNYTKMITNCTVWHGMNYPAGIQVVVDDSREQKVYNHYMTGEPQTAIWCFIVKDGVVTDQRMQVWNHEVDPADFTIKEMSDA
jgi:hypothetical protein